MAVEIGGKGKKDSSRFRDRGREGTVDSCHGGEGNVFCGEVFFEGYWKSGG